MGRNKSFFSLLGLGETLGSLGDSGNIGGWLWGGFGRLWEARKRDREREKARKRDSEKARKREREKGRKRERGKRERERKRNK